MVFAQRSTLPAPDLAADARRVAVRTRPGPPSGSSPRRWRWRRRKPTADGDGPDLLEVRAATWAGPPGSRARARCPWGQPQINDRTRSGRSSTTWAPLEDELEIIGQARLLESRSRRARRWPTCRPSSATCSPTAPSSLVTRGMLNLTHRDSREDPTALEPGVPRTTSSSSSRSMSWVFEAGHRIRLDLAGCDWPNAWSPPEPVSLTIERASRSLELPVLDGPVPSPSHRSPAAQPDVASRRNPPEDDPERGGSCGMAHHLLRPRDAGQSPGAWAWTPIRAARPPRSRSCTAARSRSRPTDPGVARA